MEFVNGYFVEQVLGLLPLAAFKPLLSFLSPWAKVALYEQDRREIATVIVNPATRKVIVKRRNFSGRHAVPDNDVPDHVRPFQGYRRFVKLGDVTFANQNLLSGTEYDVQDIRDLVSFEASEDARITQLTIEGFMEKQFLNALKWNFTRVRLTDMRGLSREIDDFLPKIVASRRCTHLTIVNTELTQNSIGSIAELIDQKQQLVIVVKKCENVHVSDAVTRGIIEKWIAAPMSFKRRYINFPIDEYHPYRTSLFHCYNDQLQHEFQHPDLCIFYHPQFPECKIQLAFGHKCLVITFY